MGDVTQNPLLPWRVTSSRAIKGLTDVANRAFDCHHEVITSGSFIDSCERSARAR